MTEKIEVTLVRGGSKNSTFLEESQPPIVLVPSDSEDNATQDSSSRECYLYENDRKRARLEYSPNPFESITEKKLIGAIQELITVQKGILETLKDISSKISENNITITQKTSFSVENKTLDEKKNETEKASAGPSGSNEETANKKVQTNKQENGEEKKTGQRKTRKVLIRNSK